MSHKSTSGDGGCCGGSNTGTKDKMSLTKKKEIKVVLLGDPNVGKSSIALRYCKHEFS